VRNTQLFYVEMLGTSRYNVMNIHIFQGVFMEDNKCMVSVLCTAFNHGEYIAQTLESFVNQKTDFMFEVLINDDVSSDDTAAIILEYAEKYPHIIRPFIQEKNLFSQGINVYDLVFYPNVRGKYIALCEGDDYWTDDTKLQRQVDFLESHPEYTACVHNTVAHMCDGSAPDTTIVPPGEDRDIPFETIIKGMSHSFHTSSILARSQYLINPPEFRNVACRYGFSDYPKALWLAMNGKVRFLERNMSVYRIASNPGSWSSKVGGQYKRLKEFITGEIEMMRAMMPLLNDEQTVLVKKEMLLREFELLDIIGQVDKMVKAPYLEIYRTKDLKYRIKHTLKRLFPAWHRRYRRKMGYGD